MNVYAFIGPSGSGKSHHAVMIAREYGAEMIIDDGLLIQGSRILAGTSAKTSPTKVGAIKTALFSEESHAKEVEAKLSALHPTRILILGTSPSMAERIAQRLHLPKPEVFISIEDVVSGESIEKARFIREHQGTHVIPAPTLAVKERFSGSLFRPIRSLFHKKNFGLRMTDNSIILWVDQTQVRPTFTAIGNFFIADQVITEIIKYVSTSQPGVERVMRTKIETVKTGIHLHVDLSLIYGFIFPDVMAQVQKRILEKMDDMTSLHVAAIDIEARRLIYPGL